MSKPHPHSALARELLQSDPKTPAEYLDWLERLIEGWRMHMGGNVQTARSGWPLGELLECVKMAGLHADRFQLGIDGFDQPAAAGAFGWRSLLECRPRLDAHDDSAILKYLRLCQRTTAAQVNGPRTGQQKTEIKKPPPRRRAIQSPLDAYGQLTRTAKAVLAIIKAQPKGRGIIGKDIIKELKRQNIDLAYSTLRRHVLPALKNHGVVNHPAAGGYLLS